jgi:hypothetical protein
MNAAPDFAIGDGLLELWHNPPPSVLSGALKIADKFTVTMEMVGKKIRLNSQGWEAQDHRRSPGRDCDGVQGAALTPARAPAGEVRADRPDWPARGGQWA